MTQTWKAGADAPETGFSCLLEPDGFSLPSPAGPRSDLAGEWGGNGANLGTGQLGKAGRGGGSLSDKPPSAGVEGPRKDGAEFQEISSPTSVLCGAGLNF